MGSGQWPSTIQSFHFCVWNVQSLIIDITEENKFAVAESVVSLVFYQMEKTLIWLINETKHHALSALHNINHPYLTNNQKSSFPNFHNFFLQKKYVLLIIKLLAQSHPTYWLKFTILII